VSILINKETRVIVLGITGAYAATQTRCMMEVGTKVVAGVSTGKAGEVVHGVPVYDTLAEAMAAHPAEACALHVGPSGCLDAYVEAVQAGFKLIFMGTEGIPPHDVMAMRALSARHNVWMVGPNSLGLITPGEALLGGIPPEWTKPGRLGLFSRSGTLCLFCCSYVTQAGIGQSTAISIGGDAVIGRNSVEYLKAFEADPDTDAILLLTEVGGGKDQEAATYIKQMQKPVVTMVVGKAAPPGRRMGHIGAVVGDVNEGAAAKEEMFRAAGAHVASTYRDLPALLRKVL